MTETLPMRDAVHATKHTMRLSAGELEAVADSFSLTGNDKMAVRLHRIAMELTEVSSILSNSYHDDVMRQVHESTQASHNMVNAALAGIQVAVRGENA
jgi:hypothetical protein